MEGRARKGQKEEERERGEIIALSPVSGSATAAVLCISGSDCGGERNVCGVNY